MKAVNKQCAGCGKVFLDTKNLVPDDYEGPRPNGCCDDCNKTTFRSKPVKPKKAVAK